MLLRDTLDEAVRSMALSAVATLAAVVAWPDPAHAQTPVPQLLTQARAAVDELRYEDALALLEQAEQAGTSGPDQLRVIYRSLAEVAATMGQTERALARYKRLLALWPEYAVPPSEPELFAKLVRDARAQLGDGPRLAIEVMPTARGRGVELRTSSDVLGLVDRVSFVARAGGAQLASNRGKTLTFASADPAIPSVIAVAHDSFGNHLIELGPVALPSSAVRAGERSDERPSRWTTPALALGGTTIALTGAAAVVTVLAFRADDDVAACERELAADQVTCPSFSRSFPSLMERRDQRALAADLLWAGATVAAASTVVYLLVHRDGRAPVTIQPRSDGASLEVFARF